jgi:hypothetical protein
MICPLQITLLRVEPFLEGSRSARDLEQGLSTCFATTITFWAPSPPLELALLHALILPAARHSAAVLKILDWLSLALFFLLMTPFHVELWVMALYPALGRFARISTQLCAQLQVGTTTCVV